MKRLIKDFVLIHGGSHGAWCWSQVIDELKQLGQRAYALDLPGHGQDQTPRQSVTKQSYLKAVDDFIAKIDSDNIVLVGHSLAGILLPDLAQKHWNKIKEVIFLAAFVLKQGQKAIDLAPEEKRQVFFEMAERSDDNTVMLDFDTAYLKFFNDFSEDKAKSFYQQLTPQPFEVYLEPSEIAPTAIEAKIRYIICQNDQNLPPQKCQQWAEILGINAEKINTGHDAMLANPAKLAELLVNKKT